MAANTTLIRRTAVVATGFAVGMVVVTGVVMGLVRGFDAPVMLVRLFTAAAAGAMISAVVSRLITGPLTRIAPSLSGHGDPRSAATAVRAATADSPLELYELGLRIAELLDTAADHTASVEAQQLMLLETNTAIDADRRKLWRLERERQASDQLLQAVVQVLPDALVVVDANLRVRVWSGVAAAMFQRDSAQAVGEDFVATCLAVKGQEVRARWGGADVARFEAVASRGDGVEFPIELTLTPVSTPRGRYHAVSVRDLAKVKQAEAEARQAQKLEAVGRLASGVAHELNTPIQFIGDSVTFAREGSADLVRLLNHYRGAILEVAPPDLVAKLAAFEDEADLPFLVGEMPRAFERTLDGVQRVATIVRAMKEFAHPESRDKSVADLNRAIASTLTVARNEVKYAAEVETDFGDLPPIACHVGELNQVFLNLLINAAHAIQDSGKHTGGTLGRIRVVTRADAEQVTVSISDDGCGIPEAVRSKIYDPFFTTKEVGRGSGQGLAIARSVVVDKHGGTISIDSQVGVGTTFHVRLPIR